MFGKSFDSQYLRKGGWLAVGPLVFLLIGARPGDVIKLTAECSQASSPANPSASARAERYLVVRSPLHLPRPVYLTAGWRRVFRNENGEEFEYIDRAANGLDVRAYVWIDGRVELADGIQMSDGRVMVGGTPRERANGPRE